MSEIFFLQKSFIVQLFLLLLYVFQALCSTQVLSETSVLRDAVPPDARVGPNKQISLGI